MKYYGSHSNFSLVILLIRFLNKNNPVGVVIMKPHLHVIDNAHQLLAGQHAKFWLDRSFN